MPELTVPMMWTESQMARVMMMRGMPELAALSTSPVQPMTPMVEATTKMSRMTMPSVPNTERSRNAPTATMTRKAVGARIPHVVLGRLRQDLVHEDIAGHVIGNIRMGCPGLGQEAAEIVVSLDLGGVPNARAG